MLPVKFGHLVVTPAWVTHLTGLEISITIEGHKYRSIVRPDWLTRVMGHYSEPGYGLQSAFLAAVLRKIGYTGEIPYQKFEGMLFPMDAKNLITASDTVTEIGLYDLEAGFQEFAKTEYQEGYLKNGPQRAPKCIK